MPGGWPVGRDGDVDAPRHRGYGFACCDCGLVHRIDFALVPGRLAGRDVWQLQMTVRRDHRATARARRAAGHQRWQLRRGDTQMAKQKRVRGPEKVKTNPNRAPGGRKPAGKPKAKVRTGR